MKPIGQSNCAIEIIFRLMMAGVYLPEPLPVYWHRSQRDQYRRPYDSSPCSRSKAFSRGDARYGGALSAKRSDTR